MLKILFRSFVLLVIAASFAAYYYAPWLKTEWQVLSGRQAFLRGDFQVAVEHLSPAIEALEQRGSTERIVYWRRALAQSHLALRQDDDALRHYRRLADSKAHFALGLRALQANEWAASIDHLKRTLKAEPNCIVCQTALANALAAETAHRTGIDAREVQTKALEEMKVPVKCLCFLAGVTAVSAGIPAFHPNLVAIVRKAGTTKQVAEAALKSLEWKLSPLLQRILQELVGDLCPPLSESELVKWALENETIKWTLTWAEMAPYSGHAHRATTAAVQTVELTRLIANYGQAFSAERDSSKQLTAADGLRAAHWDILIAASKNPRFIELGLESLTMPAPSVSRGWLSRTIDALKPSNWFSKQ